jgi:hypothetical protein
MSNAEDYVEVGYWSTIEVPVGVICACMPAIRSLFSQVFPAMFGTTRGEKSEYGYGHSRGYASKMSGKVKLNSVAGSAHIKVKQEWTVMSNPAENRSDVELRSFEQHISGVDTPKITPDVKPTHDEWDSGDDLPGVAKSHGHHSSIGSHESNMI